MQAMQEEVRIDLKDSTKDFLRVVWPTISKNCSEGVITVCEGGARNGLSILDIHSGIDFLQRLPGGLRGIASRIQWVEKCPWNTYTVRSKRPSGNKTELEKRLNHSGFLYPHLTVHAYVKKPRGAGELLVAHVCETKKLFSFIESKRNLITTNSNECGVWLQSNPSDDVEFLCVDASKVDGSRSFTPPPFDWDSLFEAA